jgi:hypothetical protein
MVNHFRTNLVSVASTKQEGYFYTMVKLAMGNNRLCSSAKNYKNRNYPVD